MKNGQTRETGNKTQEEDKKSEIHNTILDTTMHMMKTETKHNMCWTTDCTRPRQTKQQQKQQRKPKYVLDIAIHYTQTNTNNVNEAHNINEKEQRLVDSGATCLSANYCFSELALSK